MKTCHNPENNPDAPEEGYIQSELLRGASTREFALALAQASTPQLRRALETRSKPPFLREKKICAQIDAREREEPRRHEDTKGFVGGLPVPEAPGNAGSKRAGRPFPLAGQDALAPVALADMTVPQLTAAFADLNTAREKYDNLSGICATLQGIVLLEVKRKIGHGNYGNWLKEHFPKSQDVAGRFARIAEDFIAHLTAKNTPESKFRVNAEFSATRLLLGDLATNLAAIETAKLDMSHPVVQAAAAYANNRSYTQLWLALGPAPLGGDHRARDEEGELLPRPRRTNAEIERDEYKLAAATACGDTLRALKHLFSVKGAQGVCAWDILDDKALREMKECALDLRNGILASEARRAQLRPRSLK